MLKILKSAVPSALRQTLKRHLFAHQDMLTRLRNLQRAGFLPIRAIDVGASDGTWTKEFLSVWPGVPVLLIEPLPDKGAVLEALAETVKGSRFIPAAAGASEGRVAFECAQTNSHIVPEGERRLGLHQVDCITLDRVMSETPGELPNLLKIDVQGHELRVLEGGSKSLPAIEVLILEISILRIGDVPIFREVDRFLESRGFRLYDVLPQYYRPLDGALWQIDAFYVKESSPLLSSRAWD